MQKGILTRTYTIHRGEAKLKVTSTRFLSIVLKELYANRLEFENVGSVPVRVEVASKIDADVYNEDANYDEQFWNVLGKEVSAKEDA